MIYISGKITGTTDFMERFVKAEETLREQGHIPLNPAKLNDILPPEAKYEHYLKMSLAMLELCDKIYMMAGWEHSRGAWLEHDYARATGKEIIYEECEKAKEAP